MLSDKQKAAREQSLGSSDAATVAGVSGYNKSPLELYYQLHGELPRYTDDETEAQRIGSKLEPVIAELAAEKLGYKIRRAPTKRHAVHPFMVANLDFEIVGGSKGPGILECKNRGASKPFDSLPDDIALQVAHQLAVTNREWGIVAVLFGFGTLKTYEVARDKELEEYLIELEGRFMLRVQRSEPPDHTWTPETVGLLKKLYPTDTGATVELDPIKAQIAIDQFTDGKHEIERGEASKAQGEGWLKEQMGQATTAVLPGYTITWKSTKATTKFDEEEFKTQYPVLHAQYVKPYPGHRRFLVKPAKELKS